MAHKPTSKTRPASLKVGQRVIVRFGDRTVRAVLIEDRGTIGIGGRRLWRVRTASASEPPREFEMPADELTPAASPRRIARAR